MIDLKKDKQQILEGVRQYRRDNNRRLSDFNEWYNHFRVKPPGSRKEVYSNTAIPEMLSEVQSVATSVYSMVFSDDTQAGAFRFSDVYDDLAGLAKNAEAVMVHQMDENEFKKKWLTFLRFLVLNGTQEVKVPWIFRKQNRYRRVGSRLEPMERVKMDSWDFQFLNIIRTVHDDYATEMDDAGWFGVGMGTTFYKARQQEKSGYWKNVNQAIEARKGGTKSANEFVQQRRTMTGDSFKTTRSGELEGIEWLGTLDSREDTKLYRSVITEEGVFLREPEPNPYASQDSYFMKANWIDFGDEWHGMGVGEINTPQLRETTERRNLSLDLLRANLYNMWVKIRGSGIDDEDLEWSPNRVIESDMRTPLERLYPGVEAMIPAMRMEGISKEDMRRASMAFSTLQAEPLDITARESQLVHNEGSRAIRVMCVANVTTFLRKLLYKVHDYNVDYLDTPQLVAITGDEDGAVKYKAINRANLPRDLRIRIDVQPDAGSRAGAFKDMNEFLIAVGGLIQNDPSLRLNTSNLIFQAAKLKNLDAHKLIQDMKVGQSMVDPGVQRMAMLQMAQEGRQREREAKKK